MVECGPSRFEQLLRQLQDEHEDSLLRSRRELLYLRHDVNAAQRSVSEGEERALAHIPEKNASDWKNEKKANIRPMSCVSVDSTDEAVPLPAPHPVRKSGGRFTSGKILNPSNLRRSAWTEEIKDEIDEQKIFKDAIRETKLVGKLGRRHDFSSVRVLMRFQEKFTELSTAWNLLEEPDYSKQCIGKIVTAFSFNILCFAVILFDTGFTAYSLEFMISTGKEEPTLAMDVINVSLLLFYSLEILLKMVAFGKFFFLGKDLRWNILDLTLVLQAVLNILLEKLIKAGGDNVTFMRFFRLMKMGRIFRLVRALKFLRELRIILLSIASSVSALLWAFVTLGLVLYGFSLVFLQAMSGHLIDNEVDAETRTDIIEYFGSVLHAALTLYQCTSGGMDWIEIYVLIEPCGWFYTAAFIFFIFFFNFAVFNILTGLFVEKAFIAATPDREAQALEKRRNDERAADQLAELLIEMDKDGSGTISFEEFQSHSQDVYIQAYLATLGLDINDAGMFFSLLSNFNENPELPIDEFVRRCVRMRGGASSLDLQAVAFEVNVIHTKLHDILVKMGINT